MNDTVNTTPTGTTYTVSSNCGSRLPCGYCMILNRPCPMQFEVFKAPTWDPNWTPNWEPNWNKVTCQQEGTNG